LIKHAQQFQKAYKKSMIDRCKPGKNDEITHFWAIDTKIVITFQVVAEII